MTRRPLWPYLLLMGILILLLAWALAMDQPSRADQPLRSPWPQVTRTYLTTETYTTTGVVQPEDLER